MDGRRTVTAAAGALIIALAGCGGDDEASDEEAPASGAGQTVEIRESESGPGG